MAPEHLEAVLDGYSYSEWHHFEFTSRYPKLDLSILSCKEKRAVTLVASGLSQGEAAARLKITKGALQTYIKRARKKLCVLRSAHLIEEENSPGRQSGKGGGR
jgi:DNA-binding CsgD family transcriptional regulator